jgi:hypothetical protein
MTSSVIEGGHDDGSKNEPSDLIAEKLNPTVVNLSLSNETFLKAAISLKDEVCVHKLYLNVLFILCNKMLTIELVKLLLV